MWLPSQQEGRKELNTNRHLDGDRIQTSSEAQEASSDVTYRLAAKLRLRGSRLGSFIIHHCALGGHTRVKAPRAGGLEVFAGCYKKMAGLCKVDCFVISALMQQLSCSRLRVFGVFLIASQSHVDSFLLLWFRAVPPSFFYLFFYILHFFCLYSCSLLYYISFLVLNVVFCFSCCGFSSTSSLIHFTDIIIFAFKLAWNSIIISKISFHGDLYFVCKCAYGFLTQEGIAVLKYTSLLKSSNFLCYLPSVEQGICVFTTRKCSRHGSFKGQNCHYQSIILMKRFISRSDCSHLKHLS